MTMHTNMCEFLFIYFKTIFQEEKKSFICDVIHCKRLGCTHTFTLVKDLLCKALPFMVSTCLYPLTLLFLSENSYTTKYGIKY